MAKVEPHMRVRLEPHNDSAMLAGHARHLTKRRRLYHMLNARPVQLP